METPILAHTALLILCILSIPDSIYKMHWREKRATIRDNLYASLSTNTSWGVYKNGDRSVLHIFDHSGYRTGLKLDADEKGIFKIDGSKTATIYYELELNHEKN